MESYLNFYIEGKWGKPAVEKQIDLINPSTEQPYATLSMGSSADVDVAVQAARHAFKTWRNTDLVERINLLQKLKTIYQKRYEDMAQAISAEMGAPISLARDEHTALGLIHIKSFIKEVGKFKFQHPLNSDPTQQVIYSPIGVCGLITPWNWPINQLALKVIPALATGCCVVLKPSEIAPLSARLLAEMIDEAGYPPGVFNLINGDGPTVGHAITSHPYVDLVSFTGSTTAGIKVMQSAANTVKKVTLELGGKSPNIVFADARLEQAVSAGAGNCFSNTGQTCVAPTRMLVERSVYKKAVELAASKAQQTQVGNPAEEGPHIGPLS